jgi:peptide/nickel transport system permease protein
MVTVAFIAFLLFQYVGDPVVFLLGQDATPSKSRSCGQTSAWTSPFWCSSGTSWLNAAQGEFGLSLRQGSKVSTLIAERLPATLELALVAAVLALAWAFRWGCMPRCAGAVLSQRLS